tara:strand:+ start:321 stop:878 length:558 start_codon:yes stop_codon:yes gene_type:complete
MTDNNWKNNLKVLADQLRAEQKNKKGTESKFDKVVGYKNKKGFNDTGIPLTAKAAKQLQKNRASYRSRYVGTTLQQINEERAAAAKERWKHLRVDSNHSTDTAPTKRGYSSAELTWSNSAKESRDRYYGYSDKKIAPPAYGYGDPPYEEKEKITYVVPYERKEPEYKLTGKFPKVEEAIRNAKKK